MAWLSPPGAAFLSAEVFDLPFTLQPPKLDSSAAYHWPPHLALGMHEIKCTSSCLQLDIYPKPKPETLVYYHHDGVLDAYSLKEDGTISPNYDICLPSFLKGNYFLSGASCNGLLHLHNFTGHALWNPTTSEYKILPMPLAEPPGLLMWIYTPYGMWCDHKFEDVKVMHLKQFWLEDRYGKLFYFDLYSLKTNSWRRINCTEYDFFPLVYCACLDGVFYCKAYKKGVRGPVFCRFDLSTETMSTLPFPELSESKFKIIKYKGMLSVVEWWDDKDDVPWKFQLWSLKDGSWTRESAFHTRGIRQMLWSSPDGKLLYFASLNDELVVFDRSIGMLKHLGVKWFSSEPEIIPFVESFAQLNGISQTHEQKKEEKDEDAYQLNSSSNNNYGSGSASPSSSIYFKSQLSLPMFGSNTELQTKVNTIPSNTETGATPQIIQQFQVWDWELK